MSQPNIYQRINAVMRDVTYVQKDKAVSGGGANYKAVTHDQVISVIRASLCSHGIVIEPKQVSGEFITKRDLSATPPVKMALYSADYEVYFVNIDNPEERTCVTVTAHANDNGDKAPGKAMTYGVKTAILKQFSLETGEDDESRAENLDVELITQEQANELYPLLCDESGMFTPRGLSMCKAFKFNNITEIKAKNFDKIKKSLGA